jgi:ABC-type multidrug transport system fused ATPase/permease subunit
MGKHIALISQEPVSTRCPRMLQRQTLYTGTIKFNILLGAIKPLAEVTEDELKAVCRDANILDFIEGLPEYAIHLHMLQTADLSPDVSKLRWAAREAS